METCNPVCCEVIIGNDMHSHPDVFSLSTTARGYTAARIKTPFTSIQEIYNTRPFNAITTLFHVFILIINHGCELPPIQPAHPYRAPRPHRLHWSWRIWVIICIQAAAKLFQFLACNLRKESRHFWDMVREPVSRVRCVAL